MGALLVEEDAMKFVAGLVLVGMLGVAPCVAQGSAAGQTEAQTLQSILAELRGMHNDMRLSQTMQILLAEMQLQQNVVTRAQQKRDDVKANLEQVQNQQKNSAAQIVQFGDRADAALDPAQKKQMAEVADNLKSQLANLKTMEQQRSNDLADAESRLSKEQDALSNIQDQLNAVVKKLQPAGSE
jgi:uncharacterized phage infection (PIP) family protein YhgE